MAKATHLKRAREESASIPAGEYTATELGRLLRVKPEVIHNWRYTGALPASWSWVTVPDPHSGRDRVVYTVPGQTDIRVEFKVGDRVRIVSGCWAPGSGVIVEDDESCVPYLIKLDKPMGIPDKVWDVPECLEPFQAAEKPADDRGVNALEELLPVVKRFNEATAALRPYKHLLAPAVAQFVETV